MALNSVFETRRKQSVQAVSEDHASSFFSESQTSWVVFNPSEQIFNDVLSFSTRSRLTDTEEDTHLSQTLEHSLHDAHHGGEESLTSSHDSLSSRINAWQKATDTEISDNVASWDLDADLTSQSLEAAQKQSQRRPVPDFYGNELLRNLPHETQIQLRRSSARLKSALNRKGCRPHQSDLLTRLIGLLRWQELLKNPGSLVDDYIANTLSRANVNSNLTRYEREFSDTGTSSSAVMCGGGNSWNDL